MLLGALPHTWSQLQSGSASQQIVPVPVLHWVYPAAHQLVGKAVGRAVGSEGEGVVVALDTVDTGAGDVPALDICRVFNTDSTMKRAVNTSVMVVIFTAKTSLLVRRWTQCFRERRLVMIAQSIPF